MNTGVLVIILGVLVIFVGVYFFDEGNEGLPFLGNEQAEEEINEDEVPDGNQVLEETTTIPPASITTPKPKTSTLPKTETVKTKSVSQADIDPDLVVIVYTNSGFSPKETTVKAGQNVRFVNASDKPLWVTTKSHPTKPGQFYPEFDQGKSITKGATYSIILAKIGEWGYKNLNDEKHLGTVTILPQSQ